MVGAVGLAHLETKSMDKQTRGYGCAFSQSLGDQATVDGIRLLIGRFVRLQLPRPHHFHGSVALVQRNSLIRKRSSAHIRPEPTWPASIERMQPYLVNADMEGARPSLAPF